MKPQTRGERVASPTLHVTAWTMMTLFGLAIVLSIVLRLEVVASGEARVVPTQKLQLVQSRLEGNVTAIRIENGQSVARGDVLLELDTAEHRIELRAAEAERSRLLGERAASSAFLDTLGSLDYTFATDARSVDGALVATASRTVPAGAVETHSDRLLAAERMRLQAELARVETERKASRAATEVSRETVGGLERRLAAQQDRVAVARSLQEQQVGSRADVRNALDRVEELAQEHKTAIGDLTRNDLADVAFDSEQRALVAETRARLLERVVEIDERLIGLASRAEIASRDIAAAKLVAPVAGTVDRLVVTTVGGVIAPGDTLLHIVPDSAIEIEATFSNRDIGFLLSGQRANVRVDAFPSERFGNIRGRVTDISADSLQREDGSWNYTARIAPATRTLSIGERVHSLRVGMTGEVDVVIGERRVISYFLSPIARTLSSSLEEL